MIKGHFILDSLVNIGHIFILDTLVSIGNLYLDTLVSIGRLYLGYVGEYSSTLLCIPW